MKQLLRKIEDLGITKQELADAIGVTYATVNLWYKGVWSPEPVNRQKIIRFYNRKTKGGSSDQGQN